MSNVKIVTLITFCKTLFKLRWNCKKINVYEKVCWFQCVQLKWMVPGVLWTPGKSRMKQRSTNNKKNILATSDGTQLVHATDVAVRKIIRCTSQAIKLLSARSGPIALSRLLSVNRTRTTTRPSAWKPRWLFPNSCKTFKKFLWSCIFSNQKSEA